MLYGCTSAWKEGTKKTQIVLCELNPFVGETEKFVVKEGRDLSVCAWNVILHKCKLYYASNISGCEIGVIAIDKEMLLDSFCLFC